MLICFGCCLPKLFGELFLAGSDWEMIVQGHPQGQPCFYKFIINMIRFPQSILLLALFLGLFAASSVFAAGVSPKDRVRELLNTIKQIKGGEALSPQQQEENRKHSDQALDYLDLKELSRKTLEKYWQKRTDQERDQFTKLLSELFVYVAFPNSGKFFADLKIEFAETEMNQSTALVPVTVIHNEEGEIGIDFFLKQNSETWKVVDVHLDGVSMRNNLRNQFYSVIGKKGYDELVRRMQKKLQESKG